jgi:hypothetical protein
MKGMKTLLSLRMALALIVFGLTASVGFSRTPDVPVGTSGPLTAFRVKTLFGWAFQVRNDADTPYTALYAVNGAPGRKVVPAHHTVRAGYAFGREIPSFNFAPKG